MVRGPEPGRMSADSRWWVAALGLAVALFAVMVLPSGLFGGSPALAGLVVAALAAVAVLARRRAGPRDPGASVWELVPSWQYEGRHVESGGLTRDEQERAIEAVREQARRREGK